VIIKKSDLRFRQTILEVLKGGGVAILLCDTIYGIVGISPESEERIRDIKGRERNKPFILLIPDAGWLPRFTSTELPQTLQHIWPAKLTMILPHRKGGTLALRVPEDSSLRSIVKDLDRPLVSTSVNRGGEPPLNRIDEIIAEFESDVDLIVDSGDHEGGIPSTIVDVTTTPYRILRQGAVKIDEFPDSDR
jgi:L-threonylcarbamoyladenylate synthase